jgi:hypothetical protein
MREAIQDIFQIFRAPEQRGETGFKGAGSQQAQVSRDPTLAA